MKLLPMTQSGVQPQPYIFTLFFTDRAIAVLQVYGHSQEEARETARTVLPTCTYSVSDGDQSHGQARAGEEQVRI